MPMLGLGISADVPKFVADTTITVPDAPTLLTAAATGNDIALGWTDNSADETGFEIYRSVTGDGNPHLNPTEWSLIAIVAADAETYDDEDLEYSTVYYYIVRAINAGGGSTWSNVASDSTIPTAPTNLSVLANVLDASLQWDDNSSDETGFEIYRSLTGTGNPTTDAGEWTLIDTTEADVNTYFDGTLDPLTEYFYIVRAITATDESDWSNVASGTTGEGG